MKILLSSMSFLLAAATIARPAHADDVPAPRATVAFEVGPVIGLNINTNSLGLGPNLGLELGARIAAGPGWFTVHLRGAYERYAAEGTGTLACSPAMMAPASPCISSDNGNYQWSLLEETVTLGLPLAYRILPDGKLHPYVQVQPQLVLERGQSTAYGLTNTETAMRFGIQGAIGAQYDVGPGGIWLEAGYRWVQVQHRATGDATLGVIAVTIGYRFAF